LRLDGAQQFGQQAEIGKARIDVVLLDRPAAGNMTRRTGSG
jgi:hypothetical protein